MLRHKPIAVIVLMVTLSGCQHAEDRFLRRAVHRNEIVGTWIATKTGMEGLRYAELTTELNPQQHQLQFHPDGTCTGHAVVAPRLQGGRLTALWVTPETTCSWSLESQDAHQSLAIDVVSPDRSGMNLSLYFDEDKNGLLIWGYASDPDAWRYVEFSKSQPAG